MVTCANFNVYDEAGKIPKDFFALTVPFTVQDADFVTGGNFNSELYPPQIQNKNLYLSSAEDTNSELFLQYNNAFRKMLLGDPNYFVCDIDCNFSLHPFINGKPAPPLVSKDTIDDAFATNQYRAQREYNNIFDDNGGSDAFVGRSVINKYSQAYLPEWEHDGSSLYILAYDPASKIDNSIIIVAKIFEDEEKGPMLKFINVRNLRERRPNGEFVVTQKPRQVEILKEFICDFNKGHDDYEGILRILVDSGSGGGGFDISQYLLKDWRGKDKKIHLGLTDSKDTYLAAYADDYPNAVDKLTLFNFKKDKVKAYELTQQAINQGLVIFPKDPNVRGEIEIEEFDEEGGLNVRYQKLDVDDLTVLNEMMNVKDEIVATQKVKKPNGTIQFGLSQQAINMGRHDKTIVRYLWRHR